MKIISLLSRKGGSGKSTLTVHWGVEAQKTQGNRVVLIDTDPQGSCSSWYNKREAETTLLIQSNTKTIKDHIESCRTDGINFVIVDTVPDINNLAVHTARVSDLIVIPVRPSVLDLESISASIELASGIGKPAVIVLNQAPPGSTITSEAKTALTNYGLPICPIPIFNRLIFCRAMIDGSVASEIERKGKAAIEIRQTWQWLLKQLTGAN